MTNPTASSYHFQSHVWEFDQPPDLTSAFLEVTAVLKIGKRRSLQARGKNKTNLKHGYNLTLKLNQENVPLSTELKLKS